MPAIQTQKTTPIRVPNLSILTRFRPFCKFAKRRQSPKRHAYHISTILWQFSPTQMAIFPAIQELISCDPRAHFLRSKSSFLAPPKLLSCDPKELSCAPRAPFLRISISLQWANATNPRLPIKKRTRPALYSKANDSCANSSFDEFSMLFLCFRLRAWR